MSDSICAEKGRNRPFSAAVMRRKILIVVLLFSLAAQYEEGDWGFAQQRSLYRGLRPLRVTFNA